MSNTTWNDTTCPLCGGTDCKPLFETTLADTAAARTFRLLACSFCGLVKTDPRLSEAELQPYYPLDYWGRARPDDLAWLRHDQRHRIAFVERTQPKGRLLDIGCGPGYFLLALDPDHWDRYGLEAMPAPQAEAAHQLGTSRVIRGELHTSALPDEHFDALTCWDVIEHVPNPRDTLAAAFRLLRPGGHLFLTTPNFAGYQARRFQQDWYALSLPHHLFHYTPTTITQLLQAAGFRLQSIADRFGQENYHSFKHSLRTHYLRRYGQTTGRALYYLCKPFLHPWEWLSTRLGGGPQLAICAQRPPA